MKYLLLFVNRDDEFARFTPEEGAAMEARLNTWWEGHAKAGKIVGGLRLQGPDTATTVDHYQGNGSPTVTDGPFMEAKESIGGFGIVEVENLDEALEMARTWPAKGKVEVRPAWVDPA